MRAGPGAWRAPGISALARFSENWMAWLGLLGGGIPLLLWISFLAGEVFHWSR